MEERNTTRTENDAVHPRFTKPLTSEELETCIRTKYYYCDTCKIAIAATAEGLRNHFKTPIQDHVPCATCFYCNGPVYHYFHLDQYKVYHDCDVDNKTRSVPE